MSKIEHIRTLPIETHALDRMLIEARIEEAKWWLARNSSTCSCEECKSKRARVSEYEHQRVVLDAKNPESNWTKHATHVSPSPDCHLCAKEPHHA